MLRGLSVVFLVLVLGVTFLSPAAGQNQTLQQAVRSGQARTRFTGTGGSSGDSVMVEVSRGPKAAAGPQTVTLPGGSKLESSDSDAQSMMVLEVAGRSTGGSTYEPTSNIEIPASGSNTYVLNAFCAEFEKENPSTSTHFTLRSPEPKLACIARQSLKVGLSIQATQAAVWMYTDGVTYEHMNEKFPISLPDWNKAHRVAVACGATEQ